MRAPRGVVAAEEAPQLRGPGWSVSKVAGGAVAGVVLLLALWVWATLFTRLLREYLSARVGGGTRPVLDPAGATLHLLGARLSWHEVTDVTLASTRLVGRPTFGNPPPRPRAILFFAPMSSATGTGIGPARAVRSGQGARFAALYGTPFAVMCTRLDASVGEIIGSIERLGQLTARR